MKEYILKKYKTKTAWLFFILFGIINNSCSNYLDIVPDNIATIEMAFNMRSEAKKYLYTCYSYLPHDGNLATDPAIIGGDEMWSLINPNPAQFGHEMFQMAQGYQNPNAPIGNANWVNLYQALRHCNIFLENADRVPDLPDWEKKLWKAEVIFLKAYYHFYLVRMYGPIPIIKENLPIDTSVDAVKVTREPVDDCFDYIVELLDEAMEELPLIIDNPTSDLGRITQPIAAALKAKVLVTAASPLFNGNSDQATLKNRDGTTLFSSQFDISKWEKAVDACKEAIDICHGVGMKLYTYSPSFQQYQLSDTIVTQLSIRNAFCEKWNSEIIWANTKTPRGNILQNQRLSSANLDIRYIDNFQMRAQLQPPLKIARMFYTDNGVPIEEDKEWNGVDIVELKVAQEEDNLYVREGYTTIQLHFDREPRFYANLGFDGGVWYGQGKYDDSKPDDLFYVACRRNGTQGKRGPEFGPFTGYYWKKCVHFQNVQSSENGYDIEYYPWPIIRLADLYLLYAEAINEAEGPNGENQEELFKYIDLVRERAGLEGVKYSWNNFTNIKKYENQQGMREILHRERLIELALEGQRYWDIRRWKTAPNYYQTPIESWNVNVSESDPALFYVVVPLFEQKFYVKDYFWPIRDSYIVNNRNLVQNIGW